SVTPSPPTIRSNHGLTACQRMAYEGGAVGDVVSSCNDSDAACIGMASDGGKVEKVERSCNNGGEAGCAEIAIEGGEVGSVVSSCNNGEFGEARARSKLSFLLGSLTPPPGHSCNHFAISMF
ncbi:hypothetical protein THAOC_01814, partial [Thalassiosira oceanica]